MEVALKEVEGTGKVVSCGIVPVPRSLAEKNGAVPDPGRVDQAKARFASAGLKGAASLIDAIQLLETERDVIGYFGFTFDREGLTKKPLEPGETQPERGMKIMGLPHPQWGNRSGTATAIGDLVTLAEDPKLERVLVEHLALLSEVFEEGALFLSKNSTEGRA